MFTWFYQYSSIQISDFYNYLEKIQKKNWEREIILTDGLIYWQTDLPINAQPTGSIKHEISKGALK